MSYVVENFYRKIFRYLDCKSSEKALKNKNTHIFKNWLMKQSLSELYLKSFHEGQNGIPFSLKL